MADVKWIKIVTDIFSDEKIRFIETMPNGEQIIVIWFKLICLAGKCNSNGFLMMTDKIAYTDEMLASIFNRDVKVVQSALLIFEKLAMIEIIDNKIYLTNWEKHQSIDKLETIREKARLRVKKYRQKLLDNQCNVTETLQDRYSNAVDIDKDIDIDINKRKKESNAATFNEILSSYTPNLDLLKALQEYIKMRQRIRKPLTNHALGLALKKLDGLAVDDYTKISILEQSIMNGWQGLFPLKEDTNKSHTEGLSKWD